MKKIPIFTLLVDNQDGGYTVHVFPTKEERDDYRKNMAEDMEKEFDPEDEYEFGYPSEDILNYEIVKGKLVFEPMCFGAGQ